MSKKILLLLITIFSFTILSDIFADTIPVENIFSDIDSNYKYLNELQTLYDKGMIIPDSEGRFNPYQLLTREEFVGITMEVSCKKCIKPEVDYYFVDKYKTKPFYDVGLDNKYFYCIADAAENNYVLGYDNSTTCNDGTYLEGQNPFCVNNNIILEEAIAIILRVSGILSSNEASTMLNNINAGLIYEQLSDDISSTNSDGSAYSFYPYFKKALDYEIVEYDEFGNMNSYYMVEAIDGNLRPKKSITKEEFLHIAFVALKANNCLEKKDSILGLELNIYDSSCTKNSSNCKLSTIDNTYEYDFEADVHTTCKSGIKDPEGYIWRFYNEETGEEDKAYGEYIDNYNFKSSGIWRVYLRVIDNCGNTSEVFNTININNNLIVSLKADPIYGLLPLKVDLDGIVYGNNGSFSYEWNFGNSKTGLGKNQETIYKNKGLYEVVLKVTDKIGNIGTANALIKVYDTLELDILKKQNEDDLDNNMEDNNIIIEDIIENELNDLNNNMNNDSDFDGVNDIDDNCPLIEGTIKNNGCPILSETCSSNNNCKIGYICDIKNGTFGVCKPNNNFSTNLCNYSGGSIISGNTICETCPCDNFLDYISTIRKCDTIFPAITSPDNSIIYSKGDFFQIR